MTWRLWEWARLVDQVPGDDFFFFFHSECVYGCQEQDVRLHGQEAAAAGPVW